MNFTILIQSRNRPYWTLKLLNSIRETAYDLSQIEIVLTVDEDDERLPAYKDIQFVDLFITLVIRKRSENICEDYINKPARLSKAKYVWPLNDDCVVTTKHWDKIICEKAKESKSGIFYGRVGGINHKINYTGSAHYTSGFPLLSKKAIDVLGYFFFPFIQCYGSEGALFWSFAEVPGSVIELGVDVTNFGGKHIGDESQKRLRSFEKATQTSVKREIRRAREVLQEAITEGEKE